MDIFQPNVSLCEGDTGLCRPRSQTAIFGNKHLWKAREVIQAQGAARHPFQMFRLVQSAACRAAVVCTVIPAGEAS